MAAPSEKFPKKEKVILTPLELLERSRKDSVTRNEKYTEKLQVNHRALVKRIAHAVQEITNKGMFVLRIPNASLGIRTLTFNRMGFSVKAITSTGASVTLEKQTLDYLLLLAKELAEGKYALIQPNDDDAFKAYMSDTFQPQDDALLQQQLVRDTLLKEQDEKLEGVYVTFRDGLLEMLSKLKPLGLGLRLQPLEAQYNRNKFDLLSAGAQGKKDQLTLSGGGSSTSDIRPYMTNIRKQLRAGTVTVVPVDYHF